MITWNDIHHKTQFSGTYGYPDKHYLDNVEMELAQHGITVQDAQEDDDDDPVEELAPG